MQPTLAHLKGLIGPELAAVDRELRDLLPSRVDVIPQVYRHTLAGGGKKLRPALVILSAKLVAGEEYQSRVSSEDIVRFAAAAEMIHLASILHDDVADGSMLRRGRPTANSQWRGKMCIFVADYVFASVYAKLSCPECSDLLRELSLAVNRMCEGEILQALNEGNLGASQSDYLAVVEGKTAALMGASCGIGARLARAEPNQAARLREYGTNLGMAFQIVDDLLDLTGDDREMGKNAGDDLRSGRMTLPLIYAFDGMADGRLAALRGLVEDRENLDRSRVQVIAGILENSGAIRRAMSVATQFAAQARAALQALPHGEPRDALIHLVDYNLQRRS